MWTIASENVWNKTHRMTGPLWVAGGLVIMAMAFVKNSTVSLGLSMGVLIVLVVVPMVYSYLEFKKEENNSEEN